MENTQKDNSESLIYFELWENQERTKDKKAEQNFKSLLAIAENEPSQEEENEPSQAEPKRNFCLILDGTENTNLKRLISEPQTKQSFKGKKKI